MTDRKKSHGPSPLESYVREKLIPEASKAEQDAVIEAWRGYMWLVYEAAARNVSRRQNRSH